MDKAQAQAPIAAGHRRIGLAKAIEYIRQEFGPNAHAGVLDHDLDVRVHSLEHDLNAARREA